MEKYIADFVKNNLNCVISGFSGPQKKAIKGLVRGFFINGTVLLRHLAQDEDLTAKWQGDKYGYHIENAPIHEEVKEYALKKAEKTIQENTVIAYDLTDIAKPSAKKMEGISRIFDGSKRQSAHGSMRPLRLSLCGLFLIRRS